MNLQDALERRANRVTPDDPSDVLTRARQQAEVRPPAGRSQRLRVAAVAVSVAAACWAVIATSDGDEVTFAGPEGVGEPVGPSDERPDPGSAVSDVEARRLFDELVEIASARTPEAMERVCAMSDCHGLSGSITGTPEGHRSAPGPDQPPSILCSRIVSDTARLLVIEGQDGLGRRYVSHVVFDHVGDEVRLDSEPAFWLGIVYHGDQFGGSRSWTAMYHPQPGADLRDPEVLMDEARSACDSTAGRKARPAGLASFCTALVELDQTPLPDGGNNAEAISDLVSLAPSELRPDLLVVRDYHRDVYVHGNPATDAVDRMSHDVQDAGARIEAFAAENCDNWPG